MKNEFCILLNSGGIFKIPDDKVTRTSAPDFLDLNFWTKLEKIAARKIWDLG
jgi:hypothetical protein